MRVIFLTSLIFLVLSGCTQSTSDSTSSDQSSTFSESETSVNSECGIVIENTFLKPIPFDSAEPVRVEAISSDLVIVTRTEGEQAGNEQLVKLQGITSSGLEPFKIQKGKNLIEQMAGFNGFFLSAGAGCETTLPGGGAGVVGQIFSSDMKSVNEALIANGAALPESGSCGGDQLAGCYAGIDVEVEISPLTISHFLWKPESEKDGNLVVLVDAYGVNAKISGATSSSKGDNGGPSNGYGATIRYPFSGCSYGSATLEFYDSQGRLVQTASGEPSIKIANGCSRSELRF
ncbi:MAG: hypothetical protein H6619_04445 [Deltaproteobacteria bacterium]|nr:hypothetical protein [Deltaproteobacteria bacterium]